MKDEDIAILLLAAKAGGISGGLQNWQDPRDGCIIVGIAQDGASCREWWNAFDNSGDALDLAAKLFINTRHMAFLTKNWVVEAGFSGTWAAKVLVSTCKDEKEAVRRAITLTAAQLVDVLPRDVVADELAFRIANPGLDLIKAEKERSGSC